MQHHILRMSSRLSRSTWTYYQHPSLHERKLSSLHMKVPEGVEHTLSRFSPEDFTACTDRTPANRSENQFYPNHKAIIPVLRDQFTGAMLLDGNSALSGVAVHFLACTATIWTVLWGSWAAEDETDKWKHEGKTMRSVSFELAHGENHFVSNLFFLALSPQSDIQSRSFITITLSSSRNAFPIALMCWFNACS